mgnify:CR=1 FL=1
MNRVELIGRPTRELELRYTESNIPIVTFTLAVNRNFTNSEGKREADFISCVAWNNIAERLNKYVKKGHLIGCVGRIQTKTFEKEDGGTGYRTDVIIDEIEFLEKKPQESIPEPDYTGRDNTSEITEESNPFADFGASIEISEDELPF